MVLISFHIPREWLNEIDELVKRGRYPSRSEFIRHAIYNLLLNYVYTSSIPPTLCHLFNLDPYAGLHDYSYVYETNNVSPFTRLVKSTKGVWYVCGYCGFPLKRTSLSNASRTIESGGFTSSSYLRKCPACGMKLLGQVDRGKIEWKYV